ncbi:MAG: hypothetical protein K940chlam9_01751 [Chlamydiae bacterium]|nr:hypothetical protein [Chlamydiota bacterium]
MEIHPFLPDSALIETDNSLLILHILNFLSFS